MGEALAAQGDLAGALASYRQALAMTEQLAQQHPDDARAQQELQGVRARVQQLEQQAGAG